MSGKIEESARKIKIPENVKMRSFCIPAVLAVLFFVSTYSCLGIYERFHVNRFARYFGLKVRALAL